ncbi:MAG: hypothetical protein Q7S48_01505 [bacterium]|nr:hypothetical protein [bacterium]
MKTLNRLEDNNKRAQADFEKLDTSLDALEAEINANSLDPDSLRMIQEETDARIEHIMHMIDVIDEASQLPQPQPLEAPPPRRGKHQEKPATTIPPVPSAP